MKTKIGKLNFDPHLIELRPINEHVVSRYRQAYRAGEDMGQPVIDRETMTIVSGAHRVMALTQEYAVKGCGDIAAAHIISSFDIHEATTMEKQPQKVSGITPQGETYLNAKHRYQTRLDWQDKTALHNAHSDRTDEGGSVQ